MLPRVSIIGAGPAGSTAAILLARGGCEVTLIEQHRFPRDKVCGECLSAAGIAVLDRVGLSKQVLDLDAVILTHAAIHSPDGSSVRLALRRPMWGLSRHRFDGFLLETARQCGATILQPARCEGVEPGEKPAIRIRMLECNRLVMQTPDFVIVADGKGALLRTPPPHGTDFGIKAHFEDADGSRDTIELFGCDGHYGGLAPIEGGRWNAAFSVPAERLKEHHGNVAGLFAEIVTENPTLKKRLVRARQVGSWLAAPLPRFAVRDDWAAGVIPVGNAAAALEPIGGEGMGLALQSAEAAAASLLDDSGEDSRTRPLPDQYRSLWRTRRPACRAAALLVSRPGLAGALVPLLNGSPLLARFGMRLLGK